MTRALAPCCFASTAEGSDITPDAQRAKLEMAMRVAERAWGPSSTLTE